MKNSFSRREFVRTSAIAGAGLASLSSVVSVSMNNNLAEGTRVGIIGLDTSHCITFTKVLNDPKAGPEFAGYKVVAAYPTSGSSDLPSSINRLAGLTEQVKQQGVEIVSSIEELLKKVNVVLLLTGDGRKHLEQAIPVLKAGKLMFIDKPVAASLADAVTIFDAAKLYKVPVFSSSSLRYIVGANEIEEGKIGKVLGADTYSPATIEKTHPDLFWYGVHGVEMLFTLMGTGCKSVLRIYTDNTDIVIGVWQDNRIGTFRGTRSGKGGYGGTAFGEKGILPLGEYQGYGYNQLLIKIIEFFNTGVVPVTAEETLEIFAFMEAADESKINGAISVDLQSIMERAKNSKG
jgi:predicted dehydrogenase